MPSKAIENSVTTATKAEPPKNRNFHLPENPKIERYTFDHSL